MKRITKRMLAVLLTLVMVIGFVSSSLSVVANAATNTIYVATTGSDTDGNGSEAAPYATIQKAVNSIEDDSVKTTILVGNGAYNVYSPNGSANELSYGSSYGHGLYVNKSNVTITKADPQGTVTLYSYIGSATAKQQSVPTVRVDGNASNVTLDGLTILPSMKSVADGVYKTAANANEFAFLAKDGLDVSESSSIQVYLPGNSSNALGTVTVNTGGSSKASDVTIQNCTIGYNNETFNKQTTNAIYTIAFISDGSKGLCGDYHIENNTLYGRVFLNTQGGTDNTFLNNQLYCSHVAFRSPNAVDLPLIRGNTQHSAHTENASGYPYFIDSNVSGATIAKYSDAEISVMAKTNFGPEGYQYAAKNKASYSVVIFKSTDDDTVMDSEEEFGYYLGVANHEMTLDQDWTITKKNVLPAEIKATVDFNGFSIINGSGLELPAPKGYMWDGDTLKVIPAWCSSSLYLDNDLNMHLYIAEGLAEVYSLRVTMNGKTVTLNNWKTNADYEGEKYVAFEGIAATKMTETIVVELVDANGAVVEGYDAYKTSVRDYADRVNAVYGEVETMVWAMRLIDATLKYGAAAQQFAGNGQVAAEALPTYGWNWEDTAAQ